MFPQQPQQQFRNTNADVKLFYRNSTWVKPPGVSQIYMMLIGGGGNNNSTTGGGSGAVTTWWGSAQNVPDNLVVSVSTGNAVNTTVNYRGTNGLNALLTANAAVTSTGGTAMTANQFTASGFFQSVAGQNGGSLNLSASATTFLSGGNKATNSITANYGYFVLDSAGFFQLQPVIVGIGSSGTSINGAIGCGASGATSLGGPGLVIIAAW